LNIQVTVCAAQAAYNVVLFSWTQRFVTDGTADCMAWWDIMLIVGPLRRCLCLVSLVDTWLWSWQLKYRVTLVKLVT